jgi:hypothetical protein
MGGDLTTLRHIALKVYMSQTGQITTYTYLMRITLCRQDGWSARFYKRPKQELKTTTPPHLRTGYCDPLSRTTELNTLDELSVYCLEF